VCGRSQSAGTQRDVRTLMNQAQKLGMTSETVDLWLNSDDLPVTVMETGRTAKGPLSITAHYSGFSDAPLQINLPPAAQTIDLQQLRALGKPQS
jgi:hypothetical protein